MDATREEWRPVPGFRKAYEVSNLGRVRSLDRFVPCGPNGQQRLVRGRLLKLTSKGPRGYLVVNLGRGNHRRVASLVAEAFIGPRPAGMDVCHRDCDTSNNAVSNLRYDTRQGNMADSVRELRMPRGTSRPCHRLTERQAVEIRAKYVPYKYTARMLAEEYGVPRSTVEGLLRSTRPTWAWAS